MSVFVLASPELPRILEPRRPEGTPAEDQQVPGDDQGWGHSMGITTLRRRDYMRAVLAQAQAANDTTAPWRALDRDLGDAELHFDDEGDLLVELHREWLRVLVARLHRGRIVAQRTVADVRDLYDEVCADHPTLRRILDTHRANPALWEPTAREHAMLARIAGLVTEDTSVDAAADLGRAVISQRIPMQRGALV